MITDKRSWLRDWAPIQMLSKLLCPAEGRDTFGMHRWQRAVARATLSRQAPSSLQDCTPAAVTVQPEPSIVWLPHGNEIAHAPIYSQRLIRTWERNGRPPLLRTPLGDLERLVSTSPGVPPAGFIFQLSRCGSTLITNMLAAVPETLVASEPDPLNSVLAAGPALLKYLPLLISALGRAPADAATRLFIKFTSWNVLQLPLIRSLFPHVPWVFVYRDPVEVLISNLREPGGWMAARRSPAHPFNRACLDGADPLDMSDAEYAARVIGAFCRAALAAPSDGRTLLEYSEIGPALPLRLAAIFGFPAPLSTLAQMEKCLAFYSKDPKQTRRFRPDHQAKRRSASTEEHAAATRFIRPLYERLRSAALESSVMM